MNAQEHKAKALRDIQIKALLEFAVLQTSIAMYTIGTCKASRIFSEAKESIQKKKSTSRE